MVSSPQARWDYPLDIEMGDWVIHCPLVFRTSWPYCSSTCGGSRRYAGFSVSGPLSHALVGTHEHGCERWTDGTGRFLRCRFLRKPESRSGEIAGEVPSF